MVTIEKITEPIQVRAADERTVIVGVGDYTPQCGTKELVLDRNPVPIYFKENADYDKDIYITYITLPFDGSNGNLIRYVVTDLHLTEDNEVKIMGFFQGSFPNCQHSDYVYASPVTLTTQCNTVDQVVKYEDPFNPNFIKDLKMSVGCTQS